MDNLYLFVVYLYFMQSRTCIACRGAAILVTNTLILIVDNECIVFIFGWRRAQRVFILYVHSVGGCLDSNIDNIFTLQNILSGAYVHIILVNL